MTKAEEYARAVQEYGRAVRSIPRPQRPPAMIINPLEAHGRTDAFVEEDGSIYVDRKVWTQDDARKLAAWILHVCSDPEQKSGGGIADPGGAGASEPRRGRVRIAPKEGA